MSENSTRELGPIDTHEVFNQPPPLAPYNYFSSDTPLTEALTRESCDYATAQLFVYGGLVGKQLQRAGRLAEKYLPELKTHDRFGHRIDRVEYPDAYHVLMHAGIDAGLTSLPWTETTPGRYVARAAHFYLHHQVDAGSCCPMTMTFAAVPTLRNQPELAGQWLPLVLSRQYDPTDRPWYEKPGVVLGMAMTEKQGGTDVRANTTRAEPLGARGGGCEYHITGHKWFCSAPMSDGFLVLAQATGGLSCFLLPRWQLDGSRNAIRILRLKDKLGNRSNASSEVEFHGARAWMIGDEGRGVANIMEMVALTRFDCIIGSAGLMRQALVQALHHCEYRSVMQRRLIEQPLMRNVLADLALESEAALTLGMRLARLLASVGDDAETARFMRVTIAVGKYWVCRRVPGFINEAAECLGGAGYIEESMLPWLYREAPLNATWEGCSNVQCLDVLRAIRADRGTLDALLAEIDSVGGADRRLDAWTVELRHDFEGDTDIEFRAREITGRLALALQASLLWKAGNTTVAEAFCASRLAGLNHTYGVLRDPHWCEVLLERARLKR